MGNLFCDRCNTRLVETEDVAPTPAPDNSQDTHTTVKGISLPTRSVAAEEDTGRRTELPDWLAGLVDEDTEFGLTDPAQNASEEADLGTVLPEDELPDWLGGGAARTPAPSRDAAEVSLPPAWLSGGGENGVVARDDLSGKDALLPDWLRGALGPDATTEGETLAAQEVPLVNGMEFARPLDAPSPEVPDAGVFSESELPDWLAQAQALAWAGGVAESVDEAPDGIPDADLKPDESPDTAESEDLALPDWLQEIAHEDVGSEQLPEWLTTLSKAQTPSQTEAAGAVFLPTTEENAPTPALAKESPGWLAGLDAAPTSVPPSTIFEEEVPLPETPEPAAAKLPSWLSDLAPVETPVLPKPEVQVFVEQQPTAGEPGTAAPFPSPEGADQIPDWLRDLDLKPSEGVPQAGPTPSAGPEPAEGQTPEPVDLVRAELPEWLQALAPPGALGGAIGEPVAAASDMLAPADVPEWVEALRPEARAEGEPPPTRMIPPTPAEPEGPLEGLIDILPSMSVVDRPAGTKPTSIDRVPETIIAQAQLWQRLLEQPRSAERPVSHGRPRGRQRADMFRWTLSVLLIVGLFAAFWLIPEGLRIAQVAPTQIAPGVPAFVEGLDRLESGDTVVLAIEYSPAYADEMSQIAAPILAHLNSRQAEILIVSSLPEGVGLGNVLPSLPDESTVAGGGYLAGGASGIAAFLARPETETADHLVVLSAEPQRLIWWLEQNALRGADALPVSIGTSASAGPLVAPYFESAQVEGWVTGLPQALAYREIRGEDGGDYSRILDLLMMAHWVVVVLLLVAFFYTLFDKKGAS